MTIASAENSWNFTVEGMHCLKCVRKIQAIGEAFQGLESLEVNLTEHLVSTKTTDAFQPEQFLKRIREAGFSARIARVEMRDKNKNFWHLVRLAVAGACAGNIMLMSVSNYAGADQTEMGIIFHWLSFILFLPVLTISAYPLFRNSLISLYNRRVSVDIPLGLAIVGASALSTYNLAIGKHEIYFDSLAMFIFFLLGSRYVIFRMQSKYLSPVDLTDLSIQKTALREGDEGIELTAINDLQEEDIVHIKANQYVPVDAEVLSESIEIDNSILTGESFPVTLRKCEKVYAGAKLISPTARIKVLRKAEDSRVSHLVEKINKRLSAESDSELLADRGAQYLTLVILALAAAASSYFYIFDIAGGLDRILALLVIACPCALAIATPLAHSLTVKNGMREGILFKSVDAIEGAHGVDIIIFDKTGTLTNGQLEVESWIPSAPTEHQRSIIAALESSSEHPVALALRRAIGTPIPITLDSRQEVTGRGVRGKYAGNNYEVRSSVSDQSKIVEFVENGSVIIKAVLIDTVKSEAHQTLDALRLIGKKVILLTGDNQYMSQNVGKALGFRTEEIRFDQNPEQKLQTVQELRSKGLKVLFVGDGVNDAPAMKETDVSISMHSSAEVTFRTSNIHLLTKNINNILSAFHMSAICTRTIWINIGLSLIYNLSFSVFALLGLISPLIAVIIMPISSLSVVLLTYLGTTWRVN